MTTMTRIANIEHIKMKVFYFAFTHFVSIEFIW